MEKYIGLMSGTSIDNMDAVMVSFNGKNPHVQASHSKPIPATLRQQILTLCQNGTNEIEQLAIAEREVAELSAQVVNELLKRCNEKPSNIKAIGSHGQTIRHLPDLGYTLQIGDPNRIAELTGIAVVADFRRRDIAAGGQGAPLVPAFHRAVFSSKKEHRIIVNIGGMSNISVLPAGSEPQVTGFDTGPGNVLMDYWCQKHKNQPFDRNGDWAGSAQPDPMLLKTMMAEPFFQRPPPKSTGRELFNTEWMHQQLNHFPQLSTATIQATLCYLTATTISQAINTHAPETNKVFVCGGGAKNKTLMSVLQSQLNTLPVYSTEQLGIEAGLVEPAAFAWLAQQTMHSHTGNLPAVTGAKGARLLGGIYPA